MATFYDLFVKKMSIGTVKALYQRTFTMCTSYRQSGFRALQSSEGDGIIHTLMASFLSSFVLKRPGRVDPVQYKWDFSICLEPGYVQSTNYDMRYILKCGEGMLVIYRYTLLFCWCESLNS